VSRREEILRAAVALATEQGTGALSVRAVAARAGVGASTLRHYFPTQDELHHAVVGELFAPQVKDRRIADPSVDAGDRLTECLAQFMPSEDAEIPLLQGWLGLYANAVGRGDGDAGARLLESLVLHARERVETWIALLDAEGRLRPAPPGRHARTLLALLDGLCLSLLAAPEDDALAEAHATLEDVVRRLVVT